MATATHVLTLSKSAKRHLNPKTIETNTNALTASINTRSLRAQGWSLGPHYGDSGLHWYEREPTRHDAKAYDGSDPEFVVDMLFDLTFDSDAKAEPPRHVLDGIVKSVADRCKQAPYGQWLVSMLDGQRYKPPADGEVVSNAELVGYADIAIPDDWDANFDHLFGLDDHVERVRTAITAGIVSSFRNRFHVMLQGEPGCGKSEICRAVKQAIGEEAVMEFDATATTAAGAIKELSEREILPRILIVEEIEKADVKALTFLLAVLDLRGEIRKVTARNTIQRDTKLLVIATVNDLELFQGLMSGALYSRFTNRVHFKRPSRDTLALILAREIAKVNGDARWIEPALDYAEEIDTTDPRVIMAICLCGTDGLLDGSYQTMLRNTRPVDEVLN